MSLENTFVLSAHGRIKDDIITVPSNTYLFFYLVKKIFVIRIKIKCLLSVFVNG